MTDEKPLNVIDDATQALTIVQAMGERAWEFLQHVPYGLMTEEMRQALKRAETPLHLQIRTMTMVVSQAEVDTRALRHIDTPYLDSLGRALANLIDDLVKQRDDALASTKAALAREAAVLARLRARTPESDLRATLISRTQTFEPTITHAASTAVDEVVAREGDMIWVSESPHTQRSGRVHATWVILGKVLGPWLAEVHSKQGGTTFTQVALRPEEHSTWTTEDGRKVDRFEMAPKVSWVVEGDVLAGFKIEPGSEVEPEGYITVDLEAIDAIANLDEEQKATIKKLNAGHWVVAPGTYQHGTYVAAEWAQPWLAIRDGDEMDTQTMGDPPMLYIRIRRKGWTGSWSDGRMPDAVSTTTLATPTSAHNWIMGVDRDRSSPVPGGYALRNENASWTRMRRPPLRPKPQTFIPPKTAEIRTGRGNAEVLVHQITGDGTVWFERDGVRSSSPYTDFEGL